MRAGMLRHRVSILSPISTARTTDGAPLVTYSTIYKDVWADVQTVSAKENFRNDMRWVSTDKIFRLRYTTEAINPKCRIVFNSETYEIQSVINVQERNREFEIIGRKTT